MSEPSLADNRSKLKDFIASIATIRGDLSNITAPPFVLDTKSTVELPAFWAERPSVFVAAAGSDDPAKRALLVLRWFISALRNQQYAGRTEQEGVKKPLNAFLGEVFVARWEDKSGTTRLVSEQVSHHPPVTACRVWNDNHGVSAEGYTRQEITFSGSVNIKQIGHATLHLSKHDETYLIPLPSVKIKGILTGGPYPELQGTYRIPSTSGYTSSIEFEGKGLFGSSSQKHKFDAKVYRDGEDENPLYTISGHWDSTFTIHDVAKAQDLETFDITTAETTRIITDPLSEPDPWESRLAWREVREALERGDVQAAVDAKSKLENGQREMRRRDGDGKDWDRLFYVANDVDEVAEQLARGIGQSVDPKETVAAWKFRIDAWNEGKFRRPYRGDTVPDNRHGDAQGQADIENETSQSTGEAVEAAQASVVSGGGEKLNGTGAVSSQPPGAPPQESGLAVGKTGNQAGGMSIQEKSQVEDFLRHLHSSSARP